MKKIIESYKEYIFLIHQGKLKSKNLYYIISTFS